MKMLRNVVVVALAICLTDAMAVDRLKVEDNSEEVSVKDKLSSAARHFSSENLSSYAACFSKSSRTSIRKETAFVFADAECHMSIVDSHVITMTDRKAEVAVKYRVNSTEIVSCVSMVKEDGDWMIHSEAIRTKHDSSSSCSADSGVTCVNGRCVIQCGGGGCPNGECAFPVGVRRIGQ